MRHDFQHVHFYPWIGESYRTSRVGGGQILLLGWSHYERWAASQPLEPLGPEATVEIIKAHIADESADTRLRFWAKCRQTVIGGAESVSGSERQAFWHSVAFHHYMQDRLENAHEIPSLEQAKRARLAFLEVLERLQPKSVIVLGSKLWGAMPYDGHAGERLVRPGTGGKTRSTWHYPAGSKSVVTSWIRHPSAKSGWNAADWHSWANAVLKHAGETSCSKCSDRKLPLAA